VALSWLHDTLRFFTLSRVLSLGGSISLQVEQFIRVNLLLVLISSTHVTFLSPVLLLVAAYVSHLLRCPFVVIFVEESGMYFSWRLHHHGYFIYVSALVDTI
jgi:hypothetical protein